ncbi:DUF1906 domain-containing protein [Streptomyces sp. NPDC004111]|uniref:DUF1906 domain-containing protein n=1 Tax=Streptomyces sp. NPDC004111 TaxID=3364690 RepID=UPI00368804DF
MYRIRLSAYVRKWSPGRGLLLAGVLAVVFSTLVLPADARAGDTRPTTSPGAESAGPAKPVHFNGWAFDTCEAPSLATMKAWRRASAYRAVGIYFGGRGRGCPRQENLNKQWIKSVDRMGWFLLPVYVGSQSPCVWEGHKRPYAIGADPWRQGTAEGRDAVRRAKWHGMIPGSTLYLDMESYDLRDKPCAKRTLTFVQAWNRELRRHQYFPGYYSSSSSGVRHMEWARQVRAGDLPAVIWFARWGSKPSVHHEPALHRAAWTPHRRIHQYAGNVRESHGGHLLNIDCNRVDALVARTWG